MTTTQTTANIWQAFLNRLSLDRDALVRELASVTTLRELEERYGSCPGGLQPIFLTVAE